MTTIETIQRYLPEKDVATGIGIWATTLGIGVFAGSGVDGWMGYGLVWEVGAFSALSVTDLADGDVWGAVRELVALSITTVCLGVVTHGMKLGMSPWILGLVLLVGLASFAWLGLEVTRS